MERMRHLDAAFWQLEDEHAALHIASVAVFDGPVLAQAEIASCTPQDPRCPAFVSGCGPCCSGSANRPGSTIPHFDLNYHLRRTAVPEPGGVDQLRLLVGRVMSQRLDPDHPLWEAWVVEGLEEGRWAMMSKLHHSMVDGIAGMTC